MTGDHHSWTLGSQLPELRPHSQAKHRIIESYLVLYVGTLTSNPKIPKLNLSLVDGFAGGGLYRDPRTHEERYGSPFLMLRSMHQAAAAAQAKRSKDFVLDVEYTFVEASLDHYSCLETSLKESEFRSLLSDKIRLIHGEFANHVDEISKRIRRRGKRSRAIFVLDQFGYASVPFSAVRSILSQLENAEIILTFATDSLIDYLSGEESMQKMLGNLGLSFGSDIIQSAKQETDWRRVIQFTLHNQIHQRSGAKYYTPFFIRSKDAHRDYWLIHLSNHSRARDVMVDLHWREKTAFAHYGRPGLFMLGYDQDSDINWTSQPFLFDDDSRAATLSALVDELPRRIYDMKNGLTFSEFFAHLTNESPATSSIFKSALAAMLRDGAVEIRDRSGEITRKVGVQEPSDLILPPAQRLFAY